VPPVAWGERSIPEAEQLTKQGVDQLRFAGSAELDRPTREAQLKDAASTLVTALTADPYQVRATYYLAAIYARTGARQCAVNLLARLSRLHLLASHAREADEVIDQLFGRKRTPDPDFEELRGAAEARDLLTALNGGSAAAAPTLKASGVPSLVLERPGKLPAVPQVDDTPAKAPQGGTRPAKARTVPMRAQVIEVRARGAGSTLVLNRGTEHKLTVGMHGALQGPSGALPDGDITITKVEKRECEAVSSLALAAAKQVTGATFNVAP
jgi:hypothetical protein